MMWLSSEPLALASLWVSSWVVPLKSHLTSPNVGGLLLKHLGRILLLLISLVAAQ